MFIHSSAPLYVSRDGFDFEVGSFEVGSFDLTTIDVPNFGA